MRPLKIDVTVFTIIIIGESSKRLVSTIYIKIDNFFCVIEARLFTFL